MNQGLIVGRVRDEITGHPVAEAIVGLNHVQSTPEAGGRLHLYNNRGAPSQNINVETDSGGTFDLWFFWDPINLGQVMEVGTPAYQLNVMRPVREGSLIQYPVTRYRGVLVAVVSLRAVADGRLPDVRSPTSVGSTIARTAMQLGRGVRIPNMFLSPGRPSPEYYALLGAAEIDVGGG